MSRIAWRGWLAAFVCIACSCSARGPAATEASTPQPGDAPQWVNQAVPLTMTCQEFRALVTSDKRTAGLAILWLDGFYSGRSGLSGLPAGWIRTAGQGVGGTCAITVNASRTVLDVIGQLHREYGTRQSAGR